VKFLSKNFTPQGHWFLELNLEWADSTVTSEEMSAFRVFERKGRRGEKNYCPVKKQKTRRYEPMRRCRVYYKGQILQN